MNCLVFLKTNRKQIPWAVLKVLLFCFFVFVFILMGLVINGMSMVVSIAVGLIIAAVVLVLGLCSDTDKERS